MGQKDGTLRSQAQTQNGTYLSLLRKLAILDDRLLRTMASAFKAAPYGTDAVTGS